MNNTSTTTCEYTIPLDRNHNTAVGGSDEWEYSQSECVTNIDTPLGYIGSINFGLSVVIVILFISLIGYIYNKISSKKPWH